MGLDDSGGYFSHRPRQEHVGMEAPMHPEDEMFAEAEENLEMIQEEDDHNMNQDIDVDVQFDAEVDHDEEL